MMFYKQMNILLKQKLQSGYTSGIEKQATFSAKARNSRSAWFS
jgi:hypothetical protein